MSKHRKSLEVSNNQDQNHNHKHQHHKKKNMIITIHNQNHIDSNPQKLHLKSSIFSSLCKSLKPLLWPIGIELLPVVVGDAVAGAPGAAAVRAAVLGAGAVVAQGRHVALVGGAAGILLVAWDEPFWSLFWFVLEKTVTVWILFFGWREDFLYWGKPLVKFHARSISFTWLQAGQFECY